MRQSHDYSLISRGHYSPKQTHNIGPVLGNLNKSRESDAKLQPFVVRVNGASIIRDFLMGSENY